MYEGCSVCCKREEAAGGVNVMRDYCILKEVTMVHVLNRIENMCLLKSKMCCMLILLSNFDENLDKNGIYW